MSKASQILAGLTYLEDCEVGDFLIKLITESDQAVTIGFLNQYGFNLMAKSPEFKSNLAALDHVFRDGVGIKLACKYHGLAPGANLNGTDLIPQVISIVNQHTSPLCFALGTEQPWLEAGSRALFELDDVHMLDGFQPNGSYVEFVQGVLTRNANDTAFPVIVLAMGMPKQEAVAAELKEVLDRPCLIICGGAIIDFKASRFKRAPKWMQRIGVEWCYRLINEPVRLFRRYVFGIPLFFSYVILNR